MQQEMIQPSSAAGIYHPICPPAPGPAPAPAPAMAPAFAPAPAPAPAFAPAPAPVTQQYQQNQQNQQTHQTQQFQQTQQIQQTQHTQQTSQQSHVYNSGASGISQVDYTSFVPQRKGGTTFAWPPKPTEVDAAPHPFAGGHVEVSYPGSAPAPAPAPAPTFVPKPAPPPVQPKPAAPVSFTPAPASFTPAPASFAPAPASFAPAPASFAPAPTSFAPAPAPAPAPPKQVHFGQPTFAPTVAPKPAPPLPSTGGPGKLGFNGGLPGLEGLGGGAGGKGVTAGRNAPRRGRGTLNPAASSGLRIPVCHTCGNQIRGPFITALGQCWCPNCFVCATPTCRRELEHIGFVEVEGKTRCETCWETDLAPVCFKCQRRIKGDCLKAIGKAYHPECFACSYCGGLFGNSAFFLEDGLPYCENDWNELFTTKCVGCGFPIEAGDRWVEALNKNFHSQCFKCAICGNNLEGQSFFAKQGKPFCKHHSARM